MLTAASRSNGYPAGIADAGETKAIASVSVVPRSNLRIASIIEKLIVNPVPPFNRKTLPQ
jgi:hypothetical protein